MTYFLSGGSKSGKSMLAQSISKSLPAPHYYLATLRPTDAEDRAIVARHLQERDGWGFTTLECECGILSALGLQKLSMLGSLPVSGLTLLLIWLLPARPELRQYGVLLAQGAGQFCTLLWNLGVLFFRQKMRLSSDESEKDALSAVQPL